MGRDLHAQLAGRVGVRGARDPAMQAAEGHGAAATREAHALGDLGHGPHAGEGTVLAGDDDHALRVAHLDRERHGHVGEDD